MSKAICVFCGSSLGNREEYKQATIKLGEEFVKNNIKLIYGGAKVGLMGILANTILKGGGEVIGVIPQGLVDKEVSHDNLTELIVVENMHQRKALMHEMSDAFIAMPGGYGTLDEIFEALTWGQLEIHKKPCAFYNIYNFYTELVSFLENTVIEGFINIKHVDMIINETDPSVLLNRIFEYQHPKVDKAEWAKKQMDI
jgi:uncharacterized protein (TIGR00730 family)